MMQQSRERMAQSILVAYRYVSWFMLLKVLPTIVDSWLADKSLRVRRKKETRYS